MFFLDQTPAVFLPTPAPEWENHTILYKALFFHPRSLSYLCEITTVTLDAHRTTYNHLFPSLSRFTLHHYSSIHFVVRRPPSLNSCICFLLFPLLSLLASLVPFFPRYVFGCVYFLCPFLPPELLCTVQDDLRIPPVVHTAHPPFSLSFLLYRT